MAERTALIQKPFGRQIGIGDHGKITITDKDGNPVNIIKNKDKGVEIPQEHLKNLAGFVMEAFPGWFEGSEGADREAELTLDITRSYPEEQPIEVAQRTLPILMGLGVTAKQIAEEIMLTSEQVRTAFLLDTMHIDDKTRMTNQLHEVISNHWPSSSRK